MTKDVLHMRDFSLHCFWVRGSFRVPVVERRRYQEGES